MVERLRHQVFRQYVESISSLDRNTGKLKVEKEGTERMERAQSEHPSVRGQNALVVTGHMKIR